MSDNAKNLSSTVWAEALNSLFNDDHEQNRFFLSDAETEAVSFLHPEKWPSTGQTYINWDLSVQGRDYTFSPPDNRILQPTDSEHFRPDAMVLGRALFSDLEPLLHPLFRHTADTVWEVLDTWKLSRAVLHIAKGWPVSPGHLCMHEAGGFFWGEGNHRYEVLKRSGSPCFYFLALPDDVVSIGYFLAVEWMEGCSARTS
ncbi:hypothetical protein ACVS9S_003242 [Cronobacter dublinensis]|uniref:hypothetical protein n=1 Tax=Cronobacter dublinensis TaxID=413497 RepID=UPI0024AF0E88|nr:hypothetical protein [Cronobacter dublinensis]MDI7390713.1 hypothetical protein [Cronobacter dublinensis]